MRPPMCRSMLVVSRFAVLFTEYTEERKSHVAMYFSQRIVKTGTHLKAVRGFKGKAVGGAVVRRLVGLVSCSVYSLIILSSINSLFNLRYTFSFSIEFCKPIKNCFTKIYKNLPSYYECI